MRLIVGREPGEEEGNQDGDRGRSHEYVEGDDTARVDRFHHMEIHPNSIGRSVWRLAAGNPSGCSAAWWAAFCSAASPVPAPGLPSEGSLWFFFPSMRCLVSR